MAYISGYSFLNNPYITFTDANGNPLSQGSVEVYIAGTSTPTTTLKDWNGSYNQAVITLDENGGCTIIGSKDQLYKIIVRNKNGGLEHSFDNIGIGSNGGTSGNFVSIEGGEGISVSAETQSGSNLTKYTISTSGGGIAQVYHDNTLSGSGTSSSPLGVSPKTQLGVNDSMTAYSGTISGQQALILGVNSGWVSGFGFLSSVSANNFLSGNGTSSSPLGLMADVGAKTLVISDEYTASSPSEGWSFTNSNLGHFVTWQSKSALLSYDGGDIDGYFYNGSGGSAYIGIKLKPNESSGADVYLEKNGVGYSLTAIKTATDGKLDSSAFSSVSGTFLTAHQPISASEWNGTYETVSANSAQWGQGGTTYTSLSEINSDEYNKLTAVDSAVSRYSGDWNTAYTWINNSAGHWNGNIATVSSNSASWKLASDIVDQHSDTWDGTHDTVSANSANWENTYNTVSANSATWGQGTTYTSLNDINSGEYNTLTAVNSAVSSYSGNWTTMANTVAFRQLVWNGTYNTVCANSAQWGQGTTYTSLNDINSGEYNTLTSVSSTIGDKLDTSAFSSVSSTFLTSGDISASEWNGTYETVSANSATWGQGTTYTAGDGIDITNNIISTNLSSSDGSISANGGNLIFTNEIHISGGISYPWSASVDNVQSWNSAISVNIGDVIYFSDTLGDVGYGGNITVSSNYGSQFQGSFNSNIDNSAVFSATNSGTIQISINGWGTLDNISFKQLRSDVTTIYNVYAKTSAVSGVSANSANWESTYSTVSANSAQWCEVTSGATTGNKVYLFIEEV